MRAANAQQFGSLGNVSICIRKRFDDETPLQIFDLFAQIEIASVTDCVLQIKILRSDALVFRHYHSALDPILQFSDVARPGVVTNGIYRVFREPNVMLREDLVELVQEMLG